MKPILCEHACAEQTMHWIQSFVVALNLCPFAKREVDKGAVRIQVSLVDTVELALLDLIKEVDMLDANPDISTSFLVLPAFLSDFFDYLDFVDYAEACLFKRGYEGIYQVASFHPDYCFEGVPPQDVTHYTNRAPYPMLHLLREAQVDEAIAYYGDTEVIPEQNMACLRGLGLEAVKKMTAIDRSI